MNNKLNLPFYIQRIKGAVLPDQNNVQGNFLRQLSQDIMSSDEKEDTKLLPLLDFCIEFLIPLDNISRRIDEFRRQEQLILSQDSDTLPDCHLTTTEQYEIMTSAISPNVADFIIEHINCNDYAKSELKESIRHKDENRFKSTIHEYDIDYSFASKTCAHIVRVEKIFTEAENEIIETSECYDHEAMNYAEYCEFINSSYDIRLDATRTYLNETATTEKEKEEALNEYSNRFNYIKEYYREGKIFEAMSFECLSDFHDIVCRLDQYAKNNELRPIDLITIKKFTRQKMESHPIIKDFFSLLTQGDWLENDFSFCSNDITDQQFLEFIEHAAQTHRTLPSPQKEATPATAICEPQIQTDYEKAWQSMPCKEEMRGKIIDFFKTIPELIKECVQKTHTEMKDGKKIDENLAFKACVFAGYFALHSACFTEKWQQNAYINALTSLGITGITERNFESAMNNYKKGSDISADAVLSMKFNALQKYMEEFVGKRYKRDAHIIKNKTAILFFTKEMWQRLNRIAKDHSGK
ncbi:hypothetical protein [uncultured Prevotella sp.]|uniref:hypothetical protein n=1 Tax=uncultured Prevotella sp. TaxID=159272 RepID=UPI0026DC6799|nr:hypothetical protein [uncultured Prevotella sp.]